MQSGRRIALALLSLFAAGTLNASAARAQCAEPTVTNGGSLKRYVADGYRAPSVGWTLYGSGARFNVMAARWVVGGQQPAFGTKAVVATRPQVAWRRKP